MARSSDINQRIVLSGADEVRRGLEQIAQAGERAGSQTRAALLAATGAANSFTTGTRAAGTSSGQMRFALQNLSFQVNDVATSLASGGDVMRVFAQQGGQFVQVFQQGGGIGAVLGAAASGIRNFITPTTAAVAALAALGVGVGVLIERAASAQESTKQFDAILRITGRSGGTTGKQLETAAESLHDVGLSSTEAREQFKKFIGEGGIGSEAPKVIRIGAELNKVFGQGSMESFISAAEKGGPALEEWAKKLGIVTGVSKEVQAQLDAAAQSAEKFRNAINDALRDQNKSLADLARNERRAEQDRDRGKSQEKRGISPEQKQEEDREVQHQRNVEDIKRAAADRINALIRQRNEENAKQLAAFNKAIEDAAQASADKQSFIAQIGQKVLGSTKELSTATQKALLDLSVAWGKVADTLAQLGFITSIVTGLQGFVTAISNLLQGQFSIEALGAAILAALPVFAALRIAALGVYAALGPVGLGLAIIGIGAAFIDLNKAWEGAKSAADGFWTLLKAFGEWLAEGFAKAVNDFIIGPIKGVLDWFQSLIDKAREVANAIGSVFGGGGSTVAGQNPSAQSAAGPGGFAAGGMVRGPGSGTSDSVRAYLSNGEFVVNAMATRMNLPILQAINTMRMPVMPRFSMPRGFAMGGLVAAGGGGSHAVHVHFGDTSFGPMMTDAKIAAGLVRHARKVGLLSAGRLPSTA